MDEPEREAGTTSIPIPQREESENIPLPDLPGQLNNHKSPIQDDYIEKYLAEKELNLTATLDAKTAW